MAIRASGPLRNKFNESLEKNILCGNSLLMTLAAMKGNSAYSLEDRAKVAKILLDNGRTKEEILKIVPQIEKDYTPTDVQVNKVLAAISGKYIYKSDYIGNKFLRTVNQEDLGTQKTKKVWKRDGKVLRQYIYENELVKELLEAIGCDCVKYHPNKGYWSCTNPDGDNKFAINIKSNKYLDVINYTRDLGSNADIITLVQYSRNCSYIEAFDYICEILGINSDSLSRRKVKQARKKNEDVADNNIEEAIVVLDEEELNQYVPNLYIGWYREGIMPWTRDKFDLRYSYKQNRVIIPLRHWETGELLGVNARTTEENYKDLGIPKYKLTPSYKKSRNLYGLYENKKYILEKGYLVLFESEKSVLKRDSLADPTGVAIGGKSISDRQVEILVSLDVDVVVSMDNDVPVEEVLFMCEKLHSQRKNKDFKIYYTIDNHGLLGEKDSIADLGKKAYDLIFAEKVLYDVKERKKLGTYLGKALS